MKVLGICGSPRGVIQKGFLAVCLVLMALPVLARLGESPEQCNKRYGTDYTQSIIDGFYTCERIYSAEGLQVTVRFMPPRKGVALPSGTLQAGYIKFTVPGTYIHSITIDELLATEGVKWESFSDPYLMTSASAPSQPTSHIHSGLGGTVVRTLSSSGGDADDLNRRHKEWKEKRDALTSAAGNQGVGFWSASIRLGTATYYAVKGFRDLTFMTSDYLAVSGAAASASPVQQQPPPAKQFQRF